VDATTNEEATPIFCRCFQTVSKTRGSENLKALDKRVEELVGSVEEPVLITTADAVELLKLAYANLEFDESTDDDRKAHLAALEHLSRSSKNAELRGRVWLMIETDRGMRRYREEGRFSNAPDTKQQGLARSKAQDIPTLMLLRQNGEEAKGWRGLPFWWPVIVTPRSADTTIFATEEAVAPTTPAPRDGAARSPASEDSA
jgi:hypothetical protein